MLLCIFEISIGGFNLIHEGLGMLCDISNEGKDFKFNSTVVSREASETSWTLGYGGGDQYSNNGYRKIKLTTKALVQFLISSYNREEKAH